MKKAGIISRPDFWREAYLATALTRVSYVGVRLGLPVDDEVDQAIQFITGG